MKVEVELDDLETLVFATSLIPKIEAALHFYKSDPFVKPHLTYAPASQRLTDALNHARRGNAGTKIKWDEPLSEIEIKALTAFWSDHGIGTFTLATKFDDVVYTLNMKGCLERGQCVIGAVWPSSPTPELKPTPNYLYRVTKRGVDMLQAAKDKDQEASCTIKG